MAVFIGGCNDVPTEVKDDMKRYKDNEQVSGSEVTYCNVDELRSIQNKEINNKNIVINNKVDFSGVKEVSLPTIKYEENYVENYKDKYAELYGFDSNKIKLIDSSGMEGGKYYEYEDKDQYFNISDAGHIAHFSGIMNNEDYNIEESKVLGKYRIGDDNKNINIDFKSGKALLSDMCDKAENWYNTNIGNETLDYKITDAIVRNVKCSGKSEVHLAMCGEYFYKGICFNNHFQTTVEEKGEECRYYVPNCTINEYTDIDSFDWFSINNVSFEVTSVKKVDKIVDFDSAVRIVTEKLSGFTSLEFEEVIPMYVTITSNFEGKDTAAPGLELEARPVYAFLIKKEGLDEDNGSLILLQNYYKNIVLVDMITGDFFTSL